MYPLNNICIFSEKPIIINRHNKRLHCDGGPAIEYEDGYKIWALNGIIVSKKIAETPANKLDPKLIFSESNADIRAQIVEKIGYSRLYNKLKAKKCGKLKLGNKIDIGYDEYTLLKLEYNGRIIPALKMLNASENIYHIEGVDPSCETIEQAFYWRYPSLKNINFKLEGIA